MKKYILLLVILLTTGQLFAQSFQKTSQGVKGSAEGIEIQIEFYTPSIVRVYKTPEGKSCEKKSLSVIKAPEKVAVSITENEEILTLKSKEIKVELNKKNGVIYFYDAAGNPLLNTKENSSQFVPFNDAGTPAFSVKEAFVLDKEEAIYGLGQLQNGKMSQRNQTKHLVQGNVEDVSPFFQSVKGYGVFWDNYSPTTFTDNAEETSFNSEVGDCIDYYLMYGGNADGVIAQMRILTGQVPMFPLWTYGYWQSKERYKSRNEVVGVVKKYRELGVPLDGIIQDWQYWGGNYLWNAMDFLNPDFGNPKQMIDDVHAMNAHMIISIWSSFGPHTKPYKELNEKGMLFDFKTWPLAGTDTWPPDPDYPSGVRVYDAYNPAARDIYWKYLNQGIFSLGMDGWWMDSTEPDHLEFKPEDMDTKTYLGSFRKVRNAYPLMSVGGVYDHQRAVTSDKRVFILTRSAFAGQQRYGANTWSGDVGSSWESLRNQIPAGLNFSLTGMSHWNTDIGGFFAGAYNKTWNDGTGAQNPLFQELYVRWMQFGVFSPMMRSHGTDVPREIYNYGKKGEPIYDALESAIHLRYTLMPYIYSTSWEVTNKQSSFMRALAMDFVNDRKVWDINDEYMFGKSILVIPVINAQYTPEEVVAVDEESGWNKDNAKNKTETAVVDFTTVKSRKVYLPAGTEWYNFFTNEKHKGGQEIIQETTIGTIPLYVKAGSIIPIGPEVQYATEKAWDHLELKVYTGANGSFTLYEDEFDNYNYEKGAYTEILLTWNDASRKLTIDTCKGSYKGMLTNRKFTVILQDGTKKTIDYNGKKAVIAFK